MYIAFSRIVLMLYSEQLDIVHFAAGDLFISFICVFS